MHEPFQMHTYLRDYALENSVIMMGSSISNGQIHSPGNLPIILADHAGGRIKGNRHIQAEGRTKIGTFQSAVLDILNIENAIKGGGRSFDKL